jgi:hypothetical protein
MSLLSGSFNAPAVMSALYRISPIRADSSIHHYDLRGGEDWRHGSVIAGPGRQAQGEARRGSYALDLLAGDHSLALSGTLRLGISVLPLYAQSTSLHTDRSGYTTGTDGNRTVNTYTDRYGNTTGWVGGKYMSTYSDGYGGTTGTIGNKRINHIRRWLRQHHVPLAEIE